MKSIITSGLEPDIAKEIRGDFKSALLLRRRLTTIINEKINSSRSNLRSKTNYADAAWPYLQADGLGYERAMEEIISLLDDTEK